LPQAIGRYRITKRLGAGGFGTVYLGFDDRLGRPVAVKIANRPQCDGDESADRFLQEARAAAALNHPHIVQLYDADRDIRGYFVVMEYIEGTTLAEELKRSGALPLPRVLRIVEQVLIALEEIHSIGMVHRDVKPSNVMLTSRDVVKLTDFGLALRSDSPAWVSQERAGTLLYMAPEQVLGENHRLDGRTDLWAVGVMLYEMLVGRAPFNDKSRQRIYEQILAGNFRPLRSHRADVHPRLEYICTRCLSRAMADRYSCAEDMRRELESLRNLMESHPEEFSTSGLMIGPSDKTRLADIDTVSQSGWSDSLPRRGEIKVVPKGLRSFDAADASFFSRLLPGPYDSDGRSPIVNFWLRWLDQRSNESTNRVGLIYGPSGSGKSSFVKAAIIPQLAVHALPIYHDFNAAQPIDALKSRLVASFAECVGLKDLTSMLAAVRNANPKRTVILFLDQFEQYLLRTELSLNHELIQALRQCDGTSLRAILLVRDEYWTQASRCMQLIEVPLHDDQNATNIPLFDRRHAARVLEAFGRAYDALPASPAPLSESQKQFINQAIDGLAEDEQVICVRIALFAELMRARKWEPKTLREIGGTQGAAVRYLQESLEAKYAPVGRRALLTPCRELLRAMLPASAGEIKAASLSLVEWLTAAGMEDTPVARSAVGLLENDLRLVTPIVNQPDGQPAYCLTHDYMLAPLRTWLADSDRMTFRGRAGLKLRELATSYERTASPRHLPSTLEWLAILWSIPASRRRPSEQRLLKVASKRVAVRCSVALVGMMAMLMTVLFVWEQRAKNQRLQLAKVDNLLQVSLDVDSNQLRDFLDQLKGEQAYARKQALTVPITNDPRHRLRMALINDWLDNRVPVSQLAEHLSVADTIEMMLWIERLSENDRCQQLLEFQRENGDENHLDGVVLAGLACGDPHALSLLSQSKEPNERALSFLAFALQREPILRLPGMLASMQHFQSGSNPAGSYVRNAFIGLFSDDVSPNFQANWLAALTNAMESDDFALAASARWLLQRQLGDKATALSANTPFAASRQSITKENWAVITPVDKHQIVMGKVISSLDGHSRSSWLGQQEVSAALFYLFADEVGLRPVNAQRIDSELPISDISFEQAVRFCNWLSNKAGRSPAFVIGDGVALPAGAIVVCDGMAWVAGTDGFRLPFQAELESAARAESNKWQEIVKTPNLLSSLAHLRIAELARNSPRPCNVGMPNPFGFRDIIGNVAEFCQDPQEDGCLVWYSTFGHDAATLGKRTVRFGQANPMPRTGIRLALDH
jgi:serine/threonine protein kinase/formylglycine-generating enzyme required for sulfatase activity